MQTIAEQIEESAVRLAAARRHLAERLAEFDALLAQISRPMSIGVNVASPGTVVAPACEEEQAPAPVVAAPAALKAPEPQPAPAPTVAQLEAVVPRDRWIARRDAAKALGVKCGAVDALIADPKCAVYYPHPSRIAWKPAGMGGARPVRKSVWAPSISERPASRKVAPDPTFPLPPRLGFPSDKKEPDKRVDVPPMHENAVAIGRTLIDPWTSTDLAARIGDPGRAAEWISSWTEIGWAKSIGFNLYRKTAAFGEEVAE